MSAILQVVTVSWMDILNPTRVNAIPKVKMEY